jgi:hypothetical protein
MVTFVGPCPNFRDGDWQVAPDADGNYFIWVKETSRGPAQGLKNVEWRKHSAKWNDGSMDPDQLEETIDAMQERIEEQYDQYLEENHFEIAQMERYEAFMREH